MTTIKDFFMNHLATKLVALFVAAVLWVVVLSSRSVELTKDIPLETILPSDLIITNELPDRIAFRLSGPKAFRKALLERPELPIKVNLSAAKTGFISYNFTSDDIKLPPGMKVLSISPGSIRIKLEKVKSTKVPVRLDLRGAPAEGYKIIKTQIIPEQVRIKGARQTIGRIKEIVSLPVDISDMTSDYEETLSFDPINTDFKLDEPAPKVFLQIKASVPNFKLKNIAIKVLTAHRYKISSPKITVYVRAPVDMLKSIDHSQVFAEIDLKDKPKGKYTVPVTVTTPKNIGVVRAVPDQVNITLY